MLPLCNFGYDEGTVFTAGGSPQVSENSGHFVFENDIYALSGPTVVTWKGRFIETIYAVVPDDGGRK